MICLLLCVLLTAQAAFAASIGTDSLGDMMVVNCKECVSLRKTPSTSADRLCTVPLGAIVTNCYPASNGFIKCEYKGKTGYILEKYLRVLVPNTNQTSSAQPSQPSGIIIVDLSGKTETSDSLSKITPAPVAVVIPPAPPAAATPVPATPVPAATPEPEASQTPTPQPTEAYPDLPIKIDENTIIVTPEPTPEPTPAPTPIPFGDLILKNKANGMTTKAYRKLEDDTETLTIICDDSAGQRVWEYHSTAARKENGNATFVFTGDPGTESFLVVYNADEGLSLLFLGDVIWKKTTDELPLSGNVCCSFPSLSVLYVGDSEGTDPIAISLNGEILWKADSQGCLGLYIIVADDYGLICEYSAVDGVPDNDGFAFFDLFGELMDKSGSTSSESGMMK